MTLLRRRPLASFFLIAFAITWGLAALFWIFGGGQTVDPSSERLGQALGGTLRGAGDGGSGAGGRSYSFWVQAGGFVAVWGPSLAGFLMAWVCEGGRGVRDLLSKLWRRPLLLWTLAAALLIPIVIEGLAAGAGLLWSSYGETGAAWPAGVWSAFAFVVGALFSGPLGEEFGWRGFALPRMTGRFGAKRAAVFLSFVWAFWHLPVFIVPNLQSLSFPPGLTYGALAFMLIGAGITMAWLTLRAGGALGPAILFHTTLLCAMLFVRPDPQPTVVWTAIAFYVVTGWTLLFWTERLGRGHGRAEQPRALPRRRARG